MVNSTARETINAGVANGVKVANKIGQLKDTLYWDCGIVYVPNRPYSLCVFSTGTDSESKKKISHISKIIYDFVNNARYSPPDSAPDSGLQLGQ